MKRDKIWLKQNSFDLVPRASSVFLILSDEVENGKEKNLSISKKQKSSGSETGKLEEKKVTAKLNFQLVD